MKRILYVLIFVPFIIFGQTTSENYIKKTKYLVKTTDGVNKVSGGSVLDENKITTVGYFDGLGRPKQTIQLGAGGSKQDLITHYSYDEYGRQTREYLPYSNSSYSPLIRGGNVLFNTQNYYQNKFPTDFSGISTGNVNSFSEKLLENSPLNRVYEQGAPGKDWDINNHTVKFEYDTNTGPSFSSIIEHRFENSTDYQEWQPIGNTYLTNGMMVILGGNSSGGCKIPLQLSGGKKTKIIYDLSSIEPDTSGQSVYIDIYLSYKISGNNQIISLSSTVEDGSKQHTLDIPANATDFNFNIYIPYTSVPSDVFYINYFNVKEITESTAPENDIINYIAETQWDSTNKKYEPTLVYDGSHFAGDLRKNITKDENWTSGQNFPKDHTTEEYINKQGQVVLKRTFNENQPHDTYYVYDLRGNLTYVIPPKAEEIAIGLGGGENKDRENFNWQDFMDNPFGGGGGGGFIEIVDSELILNLSAGFTTQPLKTNGIVKVLGWNDVPDMTIGIFANGNYTAFIRNGNLHIEGNGSAVGGFSSNFNIDLSNVDVPSLLDNLCYQYKYDNRNRLVEKKLPGKGWEYIIYDKLDRPIITQDANLRSQGKWLFTKYDIFGRVAYTGIYTRYNGRTALQTSADSASDVHTLKTTSASIIGGTSVFYSNTEQSYPLPNNITEVLTVNYYDTYIDLPSGFTAPTSVYSQPITTITRGLTTVNKVKVLGKTDWITSITYYDQKARPIYIYSKNNFLETTDIIETKLDDFTGKTIEAKTIHKKTGKADIIVVDKFEYDHFERLKKQSQNINNALIDEIIVENVYDDIGQLEIKSVGGKTNQSRLQTIDYAYNVRGWLKNINDTDNLGNDLFSFKLNYNLVEDNNHNQVKSLYNGNISETYWKTANDNYLRGYGYKYDALNRLNDALYIEPTHPTKYVGYRNTRFITYDKNGNITHIKRYGDQSDNTLSLMDQLFYTYDSGNKLLKVVDNGNNNFGFKDGTNTGDDYAYDLNGNMINDHNKKITNISYNHLNLPKNINFNNGGYVAYSYDANGNKLTKEHEIPGGDPTFTYYAGNYIYTALEGETPELQFFSHPEGYVKDDNGVFNYVYQFKDHLGNIRLSYTDSNPNNNDSTDLIIVEESNYYPFGLKHKGYNNVVSSNGNSTAQKWGYQGQELHDDLGLNVNEFKYRFYDPSYGRFWSIDPLAEDFAYNSTYAFAENKLGLGMELEGRELLGNQVIFEAIRMGYQGLQNIKNKITGGASDVKEAHNEQMRQRVGIPDPSFDSESNRIKMATGLGKIASGVSDAGHLTLDVIGTVEPTGLADGIHSLWYAAEGDYLSAGLTAGGILPYIGDGFKAGKYLKYGDEVADLVKTTGKLDGGKEIISVLKEGTLENGIKTATNVIGDLGDDAVVKLGKFGSQDGVKVGYQSANGKKGWRVDYDAKKGGHINWWNGKEKGAIIINAGQNQIDQIIKNGTF